MRTIAILCLTAFAAVICGSVTLIKIGGWLSTLSAILIICWYFLSSALIVILVAGVEADKRKHEKEEAKRS